MQYLVTFMEFKNSNLFRKCFWQCFMYLEINVCACVTSCTTRFWSKHFRPCFFISLRWHPKILLLAISRIRLFDRYTLSGVRRVVLTILYLCAVRILNFPSLFLILLSLRIMARQNQVVSRLGFYTMLYLGCPIIKTNVHWTDLLNYCSLFVFPVQDA